MHDSNVREILVGIGRPMESKYVNSVGSQIADYVRRARAFTRTGESTYGLIEWETSEPTISLEVNSA